MKVTSQELKEPNVGCNYFTTHLAINLTPHKLFKTYLPFASCWD